MTQLPGLLPLVPLVLLTLRLRRDMGNRKAFLCAAVAWGCAIVAISELAGAVGALTAQVVALAWLLAGGAAAVAWLYARRRAPVHPLRLCDSSAVGWVLACGLGALLLIVLLTALVAPPNIWDAMSYHMPRVMHWIQNGTLAHYPTHSLRQLHQNPGAELVVLQFQILAGGDRWANLPQFIGLLGSIAGASLIAQQLGASPRGQLLAAIFAGSLPMGVLQASNAQNDLLAGFWLICFVHFLLDAMAPSSRAFGWAVAAAGASLGLAVLTKATAYLYAFPFCVWFAVSHLRRFRWRAVPAGVAVALLLALLNVGHATRNAKLYGSPIGPARETSTFRTYTYTNDPMSLGAAASNVVRNAAIQLATRSEAWNRTVFDVVRDLHQPSLGPWTLYERDVNDPSSTWAGATFALYPYGWNNPDYAGNPLHLALIGGAVISLPWWISSAGRKAAIVLACVTGGLVLFSFVLRWQQWHGRLHLPMLLLAAAPVGLVLARMDRREPMALCALLAGPVALVLAVALLRHELPGWMTITGAANGDPERVRLWVLLLAAVAALLGTWVRPTAAPLVLAALMLVFGLRIAVANGAHPWTGPDSILRRSRFEQYFKNAPPHLLVSFQRLRQAVSGARMSCVGLDAHDDEHEYPLWVLLKEQSPQVRVEHINVPNLSAAARPTGQPPCRPDVVVVLKADVGQIEVRPGE